MLRLKVIYERLLRDLGVVDADIPIALTILDDMIYSDQLRIVRNMSPMSEYDQRTELNRAFRLHGLHFPPSYLIFVRAAADRVLGRA